MQQPLISVIVPIYNVEPYLHQCVDSILAQTYQNLEVILVDDGSTDNCPVICDEYAAKDSRIRVIHKKNGGLSDARNAGVEASSGEWMIFLDSDDWWDDAAALEQMISLGKDSDLVYFGYKNVYGAEKQPKKLTDGLHMCYDNGEDFLREVLTRDIQFAYHAVEYLIRSSVWKQEMIEFPVGFYFEDVATMYKLLLKAGKVAVYGEDVYCYRRREGSITGKPNVKALKDRAMVCIACEKDVMAMPSISEDVRHLLCSSFTFGYMRTVYETAYLTGKEREELIQFLRKNRATMRYVSTRGQKLIRGGIRIVGVKATIRLLGIYRLVTKLRIALREGKRK